MNRELIQNAEKFNKRNRLKKAWHKVVSFLSCIVVFCTTYALILPAITQERETFCGYDAHVHDVSCYTQISEPQRGELICSYESLGLHVHAQNCFDTEGRVLCGQADYVIHTHVEDCFDAAGVSICTIPEAVQHEHEESCYGMIGAHSHTDACYENRRGDLLCDRDEQEAHHHGESCYGAGETVLCALPEGHSHTDDCYQIGELLCTKEVGHSHTDACFNAVLTCDAPEKVVHDHASDCYRQELICTEEHEHEEACFENVVILF